MDLTLLHFTKEKDAEYDEYLIITYPESEGEYIADSKADGYKLENRCPLENSDVTLPIGSVLVRSY